VRSGLITLEQVRSVALFDEHCARALADHPQLQGRRCCTSRSAGC
jgi:dGTPase